MNTPKQVIRRVKGKGFQQVQSNQSVYEPVTTDGDTIASASKIKGIFGRKTEYVEWENTDTGEIIHIGVKVLRPGEIRLIGERVFNAQLFDMLIDSDIPAQEFVEEVKEQMGLETDGDVILKERELKVEILKKILVDEELKDHDWLMEDASDNFIDLIYNVGIGGVTETTTVDSFQEMDPGPEQQV